MQAGFAFIDWVIFIGYLIILLITARYLSNKNISTSREFFTAQNSIAAFPVALSLLATAQSAATFLGAPEFSYRYDLTLLGYSITSLLAIYIVVKVLIPKLYAMQAMSVYELLQDRYGGNARRDVGVMF